MARSLTTKGSGQADFTRTVANMDSVQRRLGTIDRTLHGTIPIKVMAGTIEAIVGTLSYVKRLGTIGRMGTVAQVTYLPRVGTIGEGGGRGTISYVKRMGTLGEGGGRGTIGYVRRLGTIGRMGTVAQVAYIPRLGTVGVGGGKGTLDYVKRLGTIGRMGTVAQVTYLPRVGTIGQSGAATGTTQVKITDRSFSGLVIRDRVPLGPGSHWQGSWYGVGSFSRWRFYVKGRPTAGSFAVVGGVVGTGAASATGTIYGPERVLGTVLDSLPPSPNLHVVGFVRPWYRQTGNLRGSVTVALGRQV